MSKKVTGVDIRRMDAQILHDEFAGQFDRYMANLCLMIVPDPVAQLASAYKALKPGGIAAFSIWGTKNKSKQFTLMKEVMAAEGITNPVAPPVIGPNFHMGQDDGALRAMFKAAGFGRLLMWHQMSTLPVLDGTSFADLWLYVNPTNVEMMKQMPKADCERLHAALSKAAEEILSAGDPIGLDTIIVVARRPQSCI